MAIKLVNGNTVQRSRSSEGFSLYPCGCGGTDVLWLQICDEHWGPWFARHSEALSVHLAKFSEANPGQESAS